MKDSGSLRSVLHSPRGWERRNRKAGFGSQRRTKMNMVQSIKIYLVTSVIFVCINIYLFVMYLMLKYILFLFHSENITITKVVMYFCCLKYFEILFGIRGLSLCFAIWRLKIAYLPIHRMTKICLKGIKSLGFKKSALKFLNLGRVGRSDPLFEEK